jgi:hypothetical protein
MGVPSKSFEDTYEDRATDMKRTVLDYIKTLRAMRSTGANAGAGATSHGTTVHLNQDGFPIVPCPASWEKVTKEDLEAMYRSYITQHYRTYRPLVPFR